MSYKSLFLCLLTFLSISFQGDANMKFTEPKKAMTFESGKTYKAVIHTKKGKITCELFPERAPLSATNFITLAEGGFYDGLTFHRVVTGFVIQGGDPEGTGQGGPGYTVPAEIGLPHEEGALAWARLPDEVNPKKRSSGSQFYITLDKVPYLDGEYTVFGHVIDGLDVTKKIGPGDKIDRIEIIVE